MLSENGWWAKCYETFGIRHITCVMLSAQIGSSIKWYGTYPNNSLRSIAFLFLFRCLWLCPCRSLFLWASLDYHPLGADLSKVRLISCIFWIKWKSLVIGKAWNGSFRESLKYRLRFISVILNSLFWKKIIGWNSNRWYRLGIQNQFADKTGTTFSRRSGVSLWDGKQLVFTLRPLPSVWEPSLSPYLLPSLLSAARLSVSPSLLVSYFPGQYFHKTNSVHQIDLRDKYRRICEFAGSMVWTVHPAVRAFAAITEQIPLFIHSLLFGVNLF